MKVLLIGMSNRNFLPDLQLNLIKQDITAELLDLLEGYFIDAGQYTTVFGKKITSKNFLKKNFQLLLNFRKAFRLLSQKQTPYDVCNIHFLDVRYFFFKCKLLKLSHKLVITTYGSDFNKYKKYSFLQKPFYKKAKRITFANELTKESFDCFYNNDYSEKLCISRFGLSLLPLLKESLSKSDYKMQAKNLFGLPEDKIIITVGINSNPNNRQSEILDAISGIDIHLKQKIFLVFPMTYGGFLNHIKEVESKTALMGIPYKIIKNYLSTEELVSLRISSDIMINLPITDQLSATMCEYLYTGNWVITGKWLPYEPIDQTGVHYDRIPSIENLSDRLAEVLNEFASFKELSSQNRELIWNFSSWEDNISSWIEVYNT
jgi:hypothetical protein